MSTSQPATTFAASHRILVSALMGALVFIGVALFFVLPVDETPPVWFLAALLAAGVGLHVVLEGIGYRTPPLDPSLDDATAATQATTRYQAGTILRFALCEAVAIASIALAFVLPVGGWFVYAAGAVVSLVLMAVHVWPSARPVGKYADALEAGGQRSGLREAFGLSAPGPIQRL